MGIVGRALRGLPFVPPAVPGELFGTWMMRVAEPYGVSLKALFSHLALMPVARQRHSHWLMLHAQSVSWEELAVAVHKPATDLCAMTPPRYRSSWPLELGVCLQCLAHARASGEPYTWQQRWTHVAATVCEQHRSWLAPVGLGELRTVRNTRGLTELAQQVLDRDKTLGDDSDALTDSALWVQQLLITPQRVQPPWGSVSPDLRQRMVNIVARILTAASTHAVVQAHAPSAARRCLDEMGNWDMQSYLLDDPCANALQLVLPRRLRARQLLLGLIGKFLRHSPTERAENLGRLPRRMIDTLSLSMRTWPSPAIGWICPTTAEFVRRCDELRVRHSISPAYFDARAKMLRDLSDNPMASWA